MINGSLKTKLQHVLPQQWDAINVMDGWCSQNQGSIFSTIGTWSFTPNDEVGVCLKLTLFTLRIIPLIALLHKLISKVWEGTRITIF